MLNLNQVTIPVLNIEQSVQFYKKLGLNLIVESLPHYARFECPMGDSTFSLHKVDRLSPGENGIWIYFEVEKLDAFVDQLVAQQMEIQDMPEDKPWKWREARLQDPDGNQLVLFFAGSNRKNPPWRINE